MLQRISIVGLVFLLWVNALAGGVGQQTSQQMQKAIDAIKARNVTNLKAVLDENHELITAKDARYGATLLHWAAALKDKVAIQELIQRKASLTEPNKEGATPLLVAIVPNSNSRKIDTADLLIIVRQLSNPQVVNLSNLDGKTALHLASEYGQIEVVQVLITEFKADVNALTKLGKKPVDYATNKEIIKILNDEMARVAKASPMMENTELHIAASKGNLEAVKTALQKNRKWLNQQNQDGETPLHLAAKHSYLNIVAYLIRENADDEIRDHAGHTFLQVACGPQMNNAPVIK